VDVEGEVVARPEGKRIDGRMGCLVTLIVGVACVALAWGIMRFRSRAQLDASAEFAEIVRLAENADGTDALRDAGCDQAAVLPMDALRGIAQRLEDDRAAKEKRTPKSISLGTDRVGIICGAPHPRDPSLTCEKAGLAFAGAVKNVMLPFVVIVEEQGAAVCTQEYAGPESMKDREPLEIPPLFSVRE
jgi:hypothetical protein